MMMITDCATKNVILQKTCDELDKQAKGVALVRLDLMSLDGIIRLKIFGSK